jgi:GNAT superfamily N-acetyltransferase
MQVTLIKASQFREASAVLRRAFYNDPLIKYVIPSASQRRVALPWLSYKGEIYTTTIRVDGVAIWIAPGDTTFSVRRALRSGIYLAPLKIGLLGSARVMTYVVGTRKLYTQVLTKLQSCWYLLGLGVEPSLQGTGVGSALIQPVLARADATGLPCYLNTASGRNLEFYQKHGFVVVSTARVPGNGPNIWAMVRLPKQ